MLISLHGTAKRLCPFDHRGFPTPEEVQPLKKYMYCVSSFQNLSTSCHWVGAAGWRWREGGFKDEEGARPKG